MKRLAYQIDMREIEMDAFGADERYAVFCCEVAGPWQPPPGFGNWFFGTVVAGAMTQIWSAHNPEDRLKLEWYARPNVEGGRFFTIEAATPRRLRAGP